MMPKRIPLTQGKFAIVDDKDFEWLSQYKWHASWWPSVKSYYAVRTVYLGGGRKNQKIKVISMAREILGLKKGDKRQSDHINHNTLDNQLSNLRIVTCQQNHFNRKNTKGYYWHKPSKKWLSRIRCNYKYIHLGYFNVEKKAHAAYLEAKKRYHQIQSGPSDRLIENHG